MTGPAGDHGPESAPAAAPTDPDARVGNLRPSASPSASPAANPAASPSAARSSSPALLLSRQRWSERDRRRPDDGILAPQQRYPGRIATP